MPSQHEIRQRVSSEIVAALERGGLPPWRRPWSSSAAGLPANVQSRQSYRGTNPLALTLAALANGWAERWWGTFNQWKELGCTVRPRPSHVRPGRWGTKIVYCRPVERTRPTDDGEQEDRFWLLREYCVFHVRQVEGAAAERLVEQDNGCATRAADYAPAERAMAAAGVPVRHGGDRAAYLPAVDTVVLPPKAAFRSAADYYRTAFHELSHATGHPTRLDRLAKNARFGDRAYAFEELVAEIGGGYACSELGVPDTGDLTNTAAYLASWLRVLRDDPQAIFRACSQSSAAADYLLARPGQAEDSDGLVLAA